MLCEANEPSLKLRKTELLLRYVLKLTKNVDNITLNCIFNNSNPGLQTKQSIMLQKAIFCNLNHVIIDFPKIKPKYFIKLPFWTLN